MSTNNIHGLPYVFESSDTPATSAVFVVELETTRQPFLITNDNASTWAVSGGVQPGSFNVAERIVIGFILSLIILTTIVGNILVCTSIIIFPSLRTLTNYFVFSLAIADVLVACLVMAISTIYIVTETWMYGDTFCLVFISFDIAFCTASIMHLSCIAYDRYSAICNPFQYPIKMTSRRVAVMLAACWVVPMLISFIPILLGWNTLGIENVIAEVKQHTGPNSCVFLVNRPYAAVASTIAFYIPCILMASAYLFIFRAARKQAAQIKSLERATANWNNARNGESGGRGSVSLAAEKKAAKTLGIIMGCFTVCWCPFFVLNIIDPFCDFCISPKVWPPITWLGYTNSMLNPILYAFFNRTFRRAFSRLLRCHVCKGSAAEFDPTITSHERRS
ncbi:5-hydroxytryptamine receptor 4-like [Ptychodera flava]|uniref:5-hydroxytryptamine receptor 4-like n=1 Tax=Ptychodera flava TaxID=63121 RepID=UPI003969CC6A